MDKVSNILFFGGLAAVFLSYMIKFVDKIGLEVDKDDIIEILGKTKNSMDELN